MTVYWTIGIIPVQDFILEATRSRDLKAGSVLLSWMMKQVLVQISPTEIVLPKLTGELSLGDFKSHYDSDQYNLPNRATGYWKDDVSLEEAKIRMAKGKKQIRDAWHGLLTEVAFADGTYVSLWHEVRGFLNCIKCPFDLVWVIKEYNQNDPNCYEDLEKLYSAVKQTRPIYPWKGYPVGKCNQCGKREAIGETTFPEWNKFHKDLADKDFVKKGFRIDENERLCGICLIKRLASYLSEEDSFPSTSQIAAAFWLKELGLEEKVSEIFKEDCSDYKLSDKYPLIYKRSWAAKAILFPELSDKRDKWNGIVKTAINAAGKSGKTVKDEPSQYLAALTFDGDSMGEKIRQHMDSLPEKLLQFTKDLRPKVEEHCCTSLYLGGDEGMILCPVEKVFPLATEIHKLWNGSIATGATLSVGISFFDRQRPMSRGLEMAARVALEHYAKKVMGKDALAVAVQTASGNEWYTADKWDSWSRFNEVLKLIEEGTLSMGWAYDVESFLESLDSNTWDSPMGRNAIRCEVKRLTFRRLSPKLNNTEKNTIWDTLNGATWWTEKPAHLEQIPTWFHLVAFLSNEWGIKSMEAK